MFERTPVQELRHIIQDLNSAFELKFVINSASDRNDSF
jgi:hypothetical protein